jgi:septal ring factor EnvC (AmiA/AmiB activator)
MSVRERASYARAVFMLANGWGNPLPESLSSFASDLYDVTNQQLSLDIEKEETRQSQLRSEIMALEEQIDSTEATLEELQQKMKEKEAQLSDCSQM